MIRGFGRGKGSGGSHREPDSHRRDGPSPPGDLRHQIDRRECGTHTRRSPASAPILRSRATARSESRPCSSITRELCTDHTWQLTFSSASGDSGPSLIPIHLAAQIRRDVESARAYFASRPDAATTRRVVALSRRRPDLRTVRPAGRSGEHAQAHRLRRRYRSWKRAPSGLVVCKRARGRGQRPSLSRPASKARRCSSFVSDSRAGICRSYRVGRRCIPADVARRSRQALPQRGPAGGASVVITGTFSRSWRLRVQSLRPTSPPRASLPSLRPLRPRQPIRAHHDDSADTVVTTPVDAPSTARRTTTCIHRGRYPSRAARPDPLRSHRLSALVLGHVGDLREDGGLSAAATGGRASPGPPSRSCSRGSGSTGSP